MGAVFTTLLEQLSAWSPAEGAAVVFAILYLLLAIRENIWCWFCAGVSTALYIWLFAGAKLYMESLLNVFYFGMAAYGWYDEFGYGLEETTHACERCFIYCPLPTYSLRRPAPKASQDTNELQNAASELCRSLAYLHLPGPVECCCNVSPRCQPHDFWRLVNNDECVVGC